MDDIANNRTPLVLLEELLSGIKGLGEKLDKLVKIGNRLDKKLHRPRGSGKTGNGLEKPDLRAYGDWDFNPIGCWKNVFSLGRNWSPDRNCETHMRHELLRHLCQSV